MRVPESLIDDLCNRLQDDGIFLDFGANVGLITKLILDRTPQNIRVISIEPDPIAFQSLRKNIKSKRVSLINAAAWSSSNQLPLFRRVSLSGEIATTSSSLNSSKVNIQVNEFEMVQTIDICELLNGVNNPRIIVKMDVEGAEYELINHMINRGCIRKIDKLYCEFHFNSIRFGYSKHIYLFIKLFLTRNTQKIESWF